MTGTFVFEGATGNRLLAELPPVITFEGLRERGYEWFDVSYRMMAKERNDPTPGAAVMISRILDLMYIQRANLSRTTFTERFTRLLGQPPMTYLTELRMELARDLLLGSTDTAKQIARRTGYSSDAAFNRAFTKHHGRSPAQWRRENA